MPRVMFCLRYFLFGMRSAFGRGEHWLAPRSQSQATVIAEEREAGLVKIDLVHRFQSSNRFRGHSGARHRSRIHPRSVPNAQVGYSRLG
jgi:hypothetical protein